MSTTTSPQFILYVLSNEFTFERWQAYSINNNRSIHLCVQHKFVVCVNKLQFNVPVNKIKTEKKIIIPFFV